MSTIQRIKQLLSMQDLSLETQLQRLSPQRCSQLHQQYFSLYQRHAAHTHAPLPHPEGEGGDTDEVVQLRQQNQWLLWLNEWLAGENDELRSRVRGREREREVEWLKQGLSSMEEKIACLARDSRVEEKPFHLAEKSNAGVEWEELAFIAVKAQQLQSQLKKLQSLFAATTATLFTATTTTQHQQQQLVKRIEQMHLKVEGFPPSDLHQLWQWLKASIRVYSRSKTCRA